MDRANVMVLARFAKTAMRDLQHPRGIDGQPHRLAHSGIGELVAVGLHARDTRLSGVGPVDHRAWNRVEGFELANIALTSSCENGILRSRIWAESNSRSICSVKRKTAERPSCPT